MFNGSITVLLRLWYILVLLQYRLTIQILLENSLNTLESNNYCLLSLRNESTKSQCQTSSGSPRAGGCGLERCVFCGTSKK